MPLVVINNNIYNNNIVNNGAFSLIKHPTITIVNNRHDIADIELSDSYNETLINTLWHTEPTLWDSSQLIIVT